MKIAVIGSGISGLSSSWLLAKKHDVKLFEKSSRIGGHSNTRFVDTPNGKIPVDTGFIIFNELNYPNLTALFKHLNVETTASTMSFSYSLDHGKYEYSGNGLKGLFGQRSNFLNPNHWRMVRDILRFFKNAETRIITHPEDVQLDEFLKVEGYSNSFVEDHILPMAGAIWSAPGEMIRKFPAKSFIDFYANHGLLQKKDRPKWRSVKGGSKEYIAKIMADSNIEVSTDDAVKSVTRFSAHVEITNQSGKIEKFDQVVFACHADEARALIADTSDLEASILDRFSYSNNYAVLHTDASQMPTRKRLWSSWNYLANRKAASLDNQMSVSYWMNSLQELDTKTDIFVTINPHEKIDDRKIHYQTEYTHPVIDANATAAQKDIWQVQGINRTWFCGSYMGFGFHEDGLQSGLAVAELAGGIKRPWTVENESGRIHLQPEQFLQAAE